MPVAQPPQPPRTDSWRFTPGKASDNERPATCPPQAQKNHLLAQVVFCVGENLFFRAVSSQVSSAPASLTSVFGMGTGGPSRQSTPTIRLCRLSRRLRYHTTAVWKMQALFSNFFKKVFGGRSGAKKQPPYWATAFKCWRKPIFPDRLQSSIFGAGELNFRVRDGNGWTLAAINTNYASLPPLLTA